MSFLETPRFPDGIAFGAIGGARYLTSIVAVQSGAEQRNIVWDQGRARWDVSQAVRTNADFETLVNFFRAVRGRAHGFRFKDFTDFSTGSSGVLGYGVGAGVPGYQLGKSYVAGALWDARAIRKPVAGTAAIYRNAALVSAGAAPGNYALDTTTGIATFVADAESGASSIIVGATTQVVLAANPGTLTAGKLLYLTGFAGADAALLNGLAHTINSVSGGGPYTFTLATNTSGKTITLGSGKGQKFAQASDTLTWTGEFDVPCRFDTDEMKAELVSRSGGQYLMRWPSIPIVEIRT